MRRHAIAKGTNSRSLFFSLRAREREKRERENEKGKISELGISYCFSAIRDELNIVPPSRLLALLNQAMKFQQYKGIINRFALPVSLCLCVSVLSYCYLGMLPPGTQFDLFRGTAPVVIEEEAFPTKLEKTIRVGRREKKKTVDVCLCLFPFVVWKAVACRMCAVLSRWTVSCHGLSRRFC